MLAQSLAATLKPIPGALVLRSDVERKAAFGVGETDKLPPEAYRPEVSEQIYGLLTERARRIARAGYSVIVDAVYAKEPERAAIEAAARDAEASFHGLFLTADLQTRIERAGRRGPDASDADARVALQQEEFALGPMNWSKVDASGTPAQTLASAKALLGK
jgi:predicted kinase